MEIIDLQVGHYLPYCSIEADTYSTVFSYERNFLITLACSLFFIFIDIETLELFYVHTLYVEKERKTCSLPMCH